MKSYQKWLRGSRKNHPVNKVMQIKKHPVRGVLLYIISALLIINGSPHQHHFSGDNLVICRSCYFNPVEVNTVGYPFT